jgi:hypothetical protein
VTFWCYSCILIDVLLMIISTFVVVGLSVLTLPVSANRDTFLPVHHLSASFYCIFLKMACLSSLISTNVSNYVNM